ncbi:hypothetical protein [Dactylosporangium sp. NPDC048998]
MTNPHPYAAPSRLPALQSGAGIARLTGAMAGSALADLAAGLLG